METAQPFEDDRRFQRLEQIVRDTEWIRVIARYNTRAGRLDPDHRLLAAVDRQGKANDLSLYYWLRNRVDQSTSQLCDKLDIGWYSALLYWKHYTTPAGRGWFQDWIDELGKEELRDTLRELLQAVSPGPGRNSDELRSLLQVTIPSFNMPGMGRASCALPTMTTFLHILYPNAMSILDDMVLRCAVGREQAVKVLDAAKRDPRSIQWFFEMMWILADRHTVDLAGKAPFIHETPLRLVDMTLWEKGHDK